MNINNTLRKKTGIWNKIVKDISKIKIFECPTIDPSITIHHQMLLFTIAFDDGTDEKMTKCYFEMDSNMDCNDLSSA